MWGLLIAMFSVMWLGEFLQPATALEIEKPPGFLTTKFMIAAPDPEVLRWVEPVDPVWQVKDLGTHCLYMAIPGNGLLTISKAELGLTRGAACP